MKAFMLALESMGKPAFSIGRIPPTPGLVDQFFNDSTGVGDRGEPDVRGPWNQGGDWQFVDSPIVQEVVSEKAGTRTDRWRRRYEWRFTGRQQCRQAHRQPQPCGKEIKQPRLLLPFGSRWPASITNPKERNLIDATRKRVVS